jgi:signal transduction histidine kinase
MTAFGETKYLLEAIDIGVSQFVSKPVEFRKLLAAITHCSNTIKLKTEVQHARHLEAISILAGGIAHDFNNLLQVVMGYISLAHMHADPDSKNFEYLTMALKGVDQARDLGLRLTTLAKGNDSPKQTKSIEPIIISTINAAFSNTNIRCEFNLPADIPTVHFNEEQLQQVISHLAENARDAMPLGGILRIAAHGQAISSSDGLMLPPGDYLHLTFTDSGTGIPADVLPKVFDPYFTTKDMGSKKGQGLGLTVCNTIIRGHGGMISAESAPGNGTTIHIWLPAATEEND